MKAIITERGMTIATFENATDALQCLPAMARILNATLVLTTSDTPTEKVPVPEGCSIEKSFATTRFIYRR